MSNTALKVRNVSNHKCMQSPTMRTCYDGTRSHDQDAGTPMLRRYGYHDGGLAVAGSLWGSHNLGSRMEGSV